MAFKLALQCINSKTVPTTQGDTETTQLKRTENEHCCKLIQQCCQVTLYLLCIGVSFTVNSVRAEVTRKNKRWDNKRKKTYKIWQFHYLHSGCNCYCSGVQVTRLKGYRLHCKFGRNSHKKLSFYVAQKCLGRWEAGFLCQFLLQLNFSFPFPLPQLGTFRSFL